MACLCTLQALRKSWSCLLVSHQHGNIRPHVQLFLLVLLSRQPAAVPTLLLPALETFNTSSYQVSGQLSEPTGYGWGPAGSCTCTA